MPLNLIKQCDSIKFMHQHKEESVDLIITDPAYSSIEKHRAIGTTTRLTNSWFPSVSNSYLKLFCKEAFRILKNNTHLYIFSDQETMFHLKKYGEDAGFKFWKFIVWDKMSIGTGWHWRNEHELICFFEKGKRKLLNKSIGDVLHSKRLKGKKYYPTEKPIDIMKTIILNSSIPGDLVLDPFMGSGVIGEASISNGRFFHGCDIEEKSIIITRKRLAQMEKKDGTGRTP